MVKIRVCILKNFKKSFIYLISGFNDPYSIFPDRSTLNNCFKFKGTPDRIESFSAIVPLNDPYQTSSNLDS